MQWTIETIRQKTGGHPIYFVLIALTVSLCLGAAPSRHRHHTVPRRTTRHRATRVKPKPHADPPPAPLPRPVAKQPAPEDTPPLSTMPVSDDDLEGWWRGDGNADDDTRKNMGTTTGGVGYVPAMRGNGFRFNGRDQAVRVADSATLKLTRSFTINAWINVDHFPSSDQHKGVIVFRGDDRPGLDPYVFSVGDDNRITFHIESEQRGEDISAPVPARRFIMVTAMLDSSTGLMEIYENTVRVAHVITSVRPLADLDPGARPGIGIGNNNSVPESPYRYPFDGVINDLRIYGRVLAPAELRSLYAEVLSVPSPLVLPTGGLTGQ